MYGYIPVGAIGRLFLLLSTCFSHWLLQLHDTTNTRHQQWGASDNKRRTATTQWWIPSPSVQALPSHYLLLKPCCCLSLTEKKKILQKPSSHSTKKWLLFWRKRCQSMKRTSFLMPLPSNVLVADWLKKEKIKPTGKMAIWGEDKRIIPLRTCFINHSRKSVH